MTPAPARRVVWPESWECDLWLACLDSEVHPAHHTAKFRPKRGQKEQCPPANTRLRRDIGPAVDGCGRGACPSNASLDSSQAILFSITPPCRKKLPTVHC